MIAPVATGEGAVRLRPIDALRGIAALLVVWLHVTQGFAAAGGGHPVPGQWLADVAQALDVGRIGVVAFFLISGFVIPWSIPAGQPSAAGAFLLRRAFRIFPAYWLSIPLSVVATCWLWNAPFGLRDLVANVLLLQDVVGARAANGVYWTLLVEMVFYLLCVVLLRSGSLHVPRRTGALAAVLLGIHVVGATAIWLGLGWNRLLVFLPLHLSLMLCGTLIRHVVDRDDGARTARRVLALLLAFWLLAFVPAALLVRGLANNYVVSSLLGVALFAAVLCSVRGNRVTDWLGRTSYSIYLFHVPVFYPLQWWVLQQPAASAWRGQHLALWLAASLAGTLLVAAAVHRWVEQPGIRAGRRCAQAWTRWHQRRGGALLPAT